MRLNFVIDFPQIYNVSHINMFAVPPCVYIRYNCGSGVLIRIILITFITLIVYLIGVHIFLPNLVVIIY